MRVNVYAEEMTDRVEVISKTTEDGEFTGLRIYLELPVTVPRIIDGCDAGETENVRGPFVHRPGDDDSAAVTFWGKRDLRDVLLKAVAALDAHHAAKRVRAPHLDRPCMGGNHYTLGYCKRADSVDRETIYECPNQGCGLYKKEVIA
jgi:hypothetical protein